jgi:acetyl-CoA C-acetyltransferase
VFDRPAGRVTAGNSAQVTDGAAWLLLASERALEQNQLTPLGRFRDNHWAALDPTQMGLGPVHAMAPMLRPQGLETDAIGAWEINEAFAAQVLACLAAWASAEYCRGTLGLPQAFAPIPRERLNRDGGAIALGHPVGASGARIILHLLHLLRRDGGGLGVASLCVGGGQGGAVLVEV